MEEELKARGLDGFYRRVKRGDKYVNRCFTDLTTAEQCEWINKLYKIGLVRMLQGLSESIVNIAELDVVTDEERREMVLRTAGLLRCFGYELGIVNKNEEEGD